MALGLFLAKDVENVRQEAMESCFQRTPRKSEDLTFVDQVLILFRQNSMFVGNVRSVRGDVGVNTRVKFDFATMS